MDVNDYIKSDSHVLSKEDIGTHRPRVVISGVDLTEFDPGERKLVLSFQGKEKGFVLNKTNARVICDIWGSETNFWIGKTVELWVDPYVTFQGKQVGGLKIMPIVQTNPEAAPAAPAAPAPAAPSAPAGEFDDDIPF